MAVTISDWNTEVAKYVKFSSSYATLVTAEVLETLRDFCRDTGIWKEPIADISVVADTATYSLNLPTGNGDSPELAWIDSVKYKENGMDDDQYWTLDASVDGNIIPHRRPVSISADHPRTLSYIQFRPQPLLMASGSKLVSSRPMIPPLHHSGFG
jgi:hypothetical protein